VNEEQDQGQKKQTLVMTAPYGKAQRKVAETNTYESERADKAARRLGTRATATLSS
jgi:hypothetical protein